MKAFIHHFFSQLVLGLLVSVLGAVLLGGFTVAQNVAILNQKLDDLTVAVNKEAGNHEQRIVILENARRGYR